MKKILFVCTGNTCRSPMAEAIFQYRSGDNFDWIADSAGTFASSGEPASPYAIQAMAEWGVDLSGHRSKPISASLVDSAQLIVTMSSSHAEALLAQFPHLAGRVFLLNAFRTSKMPSGISDPFGAPLEVYQKTRDEIDQAMSDLLVYLHQNEPENPSS